MGTAITVGFRLGRWSSHLREHTIQVDKTMTALGRQPREVDRLIRLVLGQYGRLEAVIFARDPAAIDRPGRDELSAADVVRAAITQAPALAAELRSTAGTMRARPR
jgi:hypothetical protein